MTDQPKPTRADVAAAEDIYNEVEVLSGCNIAARERERFANILACYMAPQREALRKCVDALSVLRLPTKDFCGWEDCHGNAIDDQLNAAEFAARKALEEA